MDIELDILVEQLVKLLVAHILVSQAVTPVEQLLDIAEIIDSY